MEVFKESMIFFQVSIFNNLKDFVLGDSEVVCEPLVKET